MDSTLELKAYGAAPGWKGYSASNIPFGVITAKNALDNLKSPRYIRCVVFGFGGLTPVQVSEVMSEA
ncbi:MAG: hypothetical protein WC986_14145 [Elusimicrobiota bacterium]|jgi:hypothetical protein